MLPWTEKKAFPLQRTAGGHVEVPHPAVCGERLQTRRQRPQQEQEVFSFLWKEKYLAGEGSCARFLCLGIQYSTVFIWVKFSLWFKKQTKNIRKKETR